MLTLGTGVGGAILIGGELYRGAQGAAGEMGHMVVVPDGPDVRAGLPGPRLPRGARLRHARWRARRARRRGATRPAGWAARSPRAARSAGRSSPSWPTTATRARVAVLTALGEWLGIGLASLVNIFNPDVVVIGGGVIGAGELILAPARRVMASRALALPAGHVEIRPARFGAEAGMLGAARLRARAGPPAGAHMSVAGRLIVCPTPIGNLEDVTLRVLAALRAADVVACEDTRHTRTLLDRYGMTGELVSYHEHNERERAGELVERMRRGAVVALVSDAGMPLVSDPGYVLVQACIAAGPLDRGAARAELGAGGARRLGPAVGSLALRRLPAAQAPPSSTACCWARRRRSSPSSRRGGWSRRSTLLAAGDPTRAGRRLPRADQAPRGGAPRQRGGDRRALPRASAPRGEVVLVVAAAPPGAAARPGRSARVAALRALVEAGARPRPAAKALAELTGVPANRLYRALTAPTER